MTTSQVLLDQSKTRQFYLSAQEFQTLVEAAEPQAELAAEQLLVMQDEEKLLPEAAKLSKALHLRLLQGDEGL